MNHKYIKRCSVEYDAYKKTVALTVEVFVISQPCRKEVFQITVDANGDVTGVKHKKK